MRDDNKAARFVINWCVANSVGTIVFGWNQGNKVSIELGNLNKLLVVQIPTIKLKTQPGLCEHDIQFVGN